MHTTKVPDFVSSIEQGCTAWRRGDDSEGVTWFQKACLLWLNALEREALGETGIKSETMDQISGLLDKMIEYLCNSDVIRATDIVEYEILPLLKCEYGVGRGDTEIEQSHS
ncbi:hypothetical protein [Alicyclobacillus herbarius]|uniref:hypothetical protein n=1 Tax=Alicyclobacillus herbarius TaxID=122960 RepID=UPI00047CA289|nr:hypothetical protein [Alicyclobacillus herbarius]